MKVNVVETVNKNVTDSTCVKLYDYILVGGEKVPVEVKLYGVITNKEQIKREQEADRKYSIMIGVWSGIVALIAGLTVHGSTH